MVANWKTGLGKKKERCNVECDCKSFLVHLARLPESHFIYPRLKLSQILVFL